MVKTRADKLKDLQMPKKPMAEEEVDMDLAMEDLGELEGEELPEEAELEEMEMEEGEDMFQEYSDEELLAELQKRGLIDADADMNEDEMPEEEMDMTE